MIDQPASDTSDRRRPSLGELFTQFLLISVMGFGGVLPWTYRMVVEKRRWLSPEEFTEILAFSQFLPGGNIINFCVVVGQRFHGVIGSAVAVFGIMLAPTAIVLGLAALYLRFGQLPGVQDALGGVTAAAAGLILAIALKLGQPMFSRAGVVPLIVIVVVFAAVGVFRVPLTVILPVAAPFSIAYAWWKLR